MAILDFFPGRVLVCFPVAFQLCMLPGCSSSAGVRERPIPLSQSNATAHESAPSKPAQNAPPTDPEVRTAIQRLFGDDVQPESNPRVRFAAGDFNADASQDLLVAVKPVKEKLPELNSDLANWTIQNPRHTHVAPSRRHGVPSVPALEKADSRFRRLSERARCTGREPGRFNGSFVLDGRGLRMAQGIVRRECGFTDRLVVVHARSLARLEKAPGFGMTPLSVGGSE
jgi:hypothetical protein